MIQDDREQALLAELAQLRAELEALHAREGSGIRYLETRGASPGSTAFGGDAAEHPAVAVLEQIYRDMIGALQQMYRDTITAKDDALAARDRELKTKDTLIEHLLRRAEEAEARSSQALRYIGELDQIEARAQPARAEPRPHRRGVFGRLFSGA